MRFEHVNSLVGYGPNPAVKVRTKYMLKGRMRRLFKRAMKQRKNFAALWVCIHKRRRYQPRA